MQCANVYNEVHFITRIQTSLHNSMDRSIDCCN